jgi:GNAT superfamily N-acetyltransferase
MSASRSKFHSIEIIQAGDEDAEEVARVYADSWPRSAEHATTQEVRDELLKMRGIAFWGEEIRGIQSNRGQFLVAKRSAQVVGFAGSASDSDDCWELIWLFVTPSLHGQGVGELLHREMIAGSIQSRPKERILWAVPGNRRAERFYTDRGWQPTTAIKDVVTPAGPFPLRKWILVDVDAPSGGDLTS